MVQDNVNLKDKILFNILYLDKMSEDCRIVCEF